MPIVRRRRPSVALAAGTAALAALALAATAPVAAAAFPCTLGKAKQYASGSVTVPVSCTTGGQLRWSDSAGFVRPLSSGYDMAEPPSVLRVKPSAKGFRKLRRSCPLKVRVRFTFAPADAGASTTLTRIYRLRKGGC